MAPIYDAQYASFVVAIPLPHIYDRAWIAEHGYNGRPAIVRLAIPQDLPLHNSPPQNSTTINTTDIYLYQVKILMPGSMGMRNIEIGVTQNRDAVLAIAKAWNKPTHPEPEAQ